jgi:ABC-2 type transport system ATP-binding protein
LPAVRVVGLVKRYGRVAAVEGVSFEVPRGSVTALLGPNGAGKTTTMKCILGLAIPDSGLIEVLGEPVRGGLPARMAPRVGYVPETPEAPPWLTGCELLEYLARMEGMGGLEARVSARKALALLGAEELCSRRISSMSKGQRKRVLIAQAFLQPRDLYVMDEPMAGLDPEWVAEVRKLIAGARREGAGVLLSSHILREVEGLADAVVIIKRRLLYSGPIEGLLEAAGGGRRIVIETPQAAEAARLLRSRGFTVLAASRDTVIVEAGSVEEVVDAVRGAVAIEGVRVEKPSLEDSYLRLVRGGGGAGE